MTHISVDSHRLVKGLIARGFKEDQAEAILDAIQNVTLQDVASKEDVQTIKQQFSQLEKHVDQQISRLEKQMSELELRISDRITGLIKWQVPLMLGQAGLIVALVKLL